MYDCIADRAVRRTCNHREPHVIGESTWQKLQVDLNDPESDIAAWHQDTPGPQRLQRAALGQGRRAQQPPQGCIAAQ